MTKTNRKKESRQESRSLLLWNLHELKAEFLRQLKLEQLVRWMESANILLAISDDGLLRLVRTETDAHQAALDGFTIYSPEDAYIYSLRPIK